MTFPHCPMNSVEWFSIFICVLAWKTLKVAQITKIANTFFFFFLKSWVSMKASLCDLSSQNVIASGWYYLPPTLWHPTLWFPSWQAQSRHRQLEYRCSTLEQPPECSVSGGNGQISVCHWRTWWHYFHKYCREAL